MSTCSLTFVVISTGTLTVGVGVLTFSSLTILLRLFVVLNAAREEEKLLDFYAATRDPGILKHIRSNRKKRTAKIFTESMVKILKSLVKLFRKAP